MLVANIAFLYLEAYRQVNEAAVNRPSLTKINAQHAKENKTLFSSLFTTSMMKRKSDIDQANEDILQISRKLTTTLLADSSQ